MSNTTTSAQIDTASGQPTLQRSTDGAAHVMTVPGYPVGASAVVAAATGAASQAVASLPGVANKTNYVTGFEITGGGATGASLVVATLSGLAGGTVFSYVIAVPAGATAGITPVVVQFTDPIPAQAANTAITLTLPSLGTGNTNSAVTLHGFVM